MAFRIVVLEDDYLDWEWVSEVLSEEFPGVKLEWIPTEKAFFVLDVMLPWDVPRKEQEKPDFIEEAGSGGIYTAGLRCLDQIRQIATLSNKPYVLYTGLDRNNFPEHGRRRMKKSRFQGSTSQGLLRRGRSNEPGLTE